MPVLDNIRGLRFGAVGANATHLVVDMQRLVAEPGEWQTTAMAGITPAIVRMVKHRPERTLFSRFLTPGRAEQARGQWQIYYRRWASVTGERLSPGMHDLVPELAALAGPGTLIDKHGHSCFDNPALRTLLKAQGTDCLIVTGVETDVCVLATVLSAIDLGWRVILVEDAIASSSQAGHKAAMEAIYPRYDMQIEVLTTDALLAAWKD